MSCSVVEQLRERAVDSALSLPRRGKEVGGLLLGRFQPDGFTVSIDAFEELACEYRFGPSFTLSEDDRALLKKLLAKRRPEGAPDIVGLYRSYTRRVAALDAADQALLESFFPQPNLAVLLIEPLSPAECFAAFAFREGGSVPARSPYAAFSLDPAGMEAAAQAHPTPPEPTPAPRPPVAAAPPTAPPPEAPPEPAPAAEVRPAPVPVAPYDESAAPTRPPAQEAARAISLPAARHRLLAIDEDEPRTSAPAPEPRRRILAPLLACIVLSIGAAVVYELWNMARQPQFAQLRLDAKQNPGGIELTWDGAAPSVVLASRGVLTVQDGDARRTVDLSAKELHDGHYEYRPTHPDVLFRMALYGSGVKPWSDSLRVLSLAAPAPAASQPAAHPTTAPEPAHTGEAARSESIPDNAPPAATQAVAVHEVQPDIPSGVRSRITSRVTVPVEVRLSNTGRVLSAKSHGKGDSVYRYLADHAAKAARSWRFTPARSAHGKPVPSRKTIQFTFEPAGA